VTGFFKEAARVDPLHGADVCDAGKLNGRACKPLRYATAGGPNQVVSTSVGLGSVSTHATYPSGPTRAAAGAVTALFAGRSQTLRIRHRSAKRDLPMGDVEGALLPEVDQSWPGTMQQAVNPQRAVSRDQVEVRYTAADKQMRLTDVVVNSKSGHLGSGPFVRLFRGARLRAPQAFIACSA
jgi:hypothetical protein